MLVALVVTAFGAAVQGTIGFGFAVVSVPVLSLVDPVLVPVPQLLAAIPLTLATLWRERHAVDLTGTGWIIAGRVPGAVLGLVLLALASGESGKRLLDLLIAAFVLTAVAIQASPAQLRPTPLTKLVAGVASGTMGLVASIGGPPLGLLYRGQRGPTIRSTLAAVFMIGLSITAVARILSDRITGDDILLAVAFLPALIAGFVASFRLRGAIEGKKLQTAILLLSTIAALGLAGRAVR